MLPYLRNQFSKPMVKRSLLVALALAIISPAIWLGWTQPWQYQPQVPTGPLPERTAERPEHPLPPEVQAAKDEGMRLWGVHEWEKMQSYLEEAANHGDPEAMYFLGEAHRRQRGFSTAAIFIAYCADDYERRPKSTLRPS